MVVVGHGWGLLAVAVLADPLAVCEACVEARPAPAPVLARLALTAAGVTALVRAAAGTPRPDGRPRSRPGGGRRRLA